MLEDESVVGKVGTVTHPILAGKAGEVVVRIRGGTETFMAYAEVELQAQSEVLVVKQLSARTVEVTPFAI